MKILRNRAKCLACEDVIESKSILGWRPLPSAVPDERKGERRKHEERCFYYPRDYRIEIDGSTSGKPAKRFFLPKGGVDGLLKNRRLTTRRSSNRGRSARKDKA